MQVKNCKDFPTMWDWAISDCEQQIKASQCEQRIKELKSAINVFKLCKANGTLWPTEWPTKEKAPKSAELLLRASDTTRTKVLHVTRPSASHTVQSTRLRSDAKLDKIVKTLLQSQNLQRIVDKLKETIDVR